MWKLLKELFNTPSAEREPEPWATRAAAHFGVGTVLCLIMVPLLGPWGAVAIISAAYALWELCQWPGGLRMAWDGILDWVAVVLGAVAAGNITGATPWAGAAIAVCAVIVALAGIWARAAR